MRKLTPVWVSYRDDFLILYWVYIMTESFHISLSRRWGDLCRHDILWWYHVNKYRAMRGNRSELAPAPKSPRCHVKTTSVQAGTSFNRKMKKGKSTFSFVAELYYHQFLGRFLFNFRRRWQLAFSENKECVRTATASNQSCKHLFLKNP